MTTRASAPRPNRRRHPIDEWTEDAPPRSLDVWLYVLVIACSGLISLGVWGLILAGIAWGP